MCTSHLVHIVLSPEPRALPLRDKHCPNWAPDLVFGTAGCLVGTGTHISQAGLALTVAGMIRSRLSRQMLRSRACPLTPGAGTTACLLARFSNLSVILNVTVLVAVFWVPSLPPPLFFSLSCFLFLTTSLFSVPPPTPCHCCKQSTLTGLQERS